MSETTCALSIWGDNLDPDEITQLLGTQPSRIYTKGETKTLANGRVRITPTNGWRLEAGFSKPGDLDHQIAEVLANLPSDLTLWADLARRFKIDMFCGLFLEEGNEGLYISSGTTELLGARNIALDLDIYSRSLDD